MHSELHFSGSIFYTRMGLALSNLSDNVSENVPLTAQKTTGLAHRSETALFPKATGQRLEAQRPLPAALNGRETQRT
jgi:hypothetical protein